MKRPWRKNKWVYLMSFAVMLALLLTLVGWQIKWHLEEELVVKLSPSAHSITIANNQTAPISFVIETDSWGQCKPSCEVTLWDVSHDTVLDAQPKNTEKKKTYEYLITPPRTGEGQVLLSLEASCKNQPSPLCQSDGELRVKRALVTLNYALTPEQERSKQIFGPLLQNALNERARAEKTLQELQVVNARLPAVILERTPQLRTQESLEETLTLLNASLTTRLIVWDSQRYEDLTAPLSYADTITLIEEQKQQSSALLASYNAHVSTLQQANLQAIPRTESFLNTLGNPTLTSALYERVQALVNTSFGTTNLNETNTTVHSVNTYITFLNTLEAQGIAYQLRLQTHAGIPLNNTFSCATLAALQYTNTSNNLTSFEKNLLEANTPLRAKAYLNTSASKLPQATQSYVTTYCQGLPVRSISELLTNFSIPTLTNSTPPAYLSTPEMLSEHNPQCCYANTCQACATESSTPILFIHGHQVSDENTPISSMRSFGKLQQALESEGYIHAGELFLDENIPPGDWGRSGHPLTVRASYYYITHYDVAGLDLTVQQSERIENYALRLNEIIRELKYRTGSDQVIIIAHSMGGLVAREYIQLFGEQAIEKLVLINTPNFGVTGRVAELCDLFGSYKECEDLEEGSIFLTRLNKNPYVNIDNFYSTGCEMKEGPGDGIALAEKVILPGARNYHITGTCTDRLQTSLHSDVLNPQAYPAVYSQLLQVLNATS